MKEGRAVVRNTGSRRGQVSDGSAECAVMGNDSLAIWSSGGMAAA